MFWPKPRKPDDLRLLAPGVESAGDHAGGEQSARLGAMDVLQSLRVGMNVLGLEVHDLATDHAVDGSGGVRDLGDDGHARLRRALQTCQHFVSASLQRVAGEDGCRLAESLVAGGKTTAQVIVVQRGQSRRG